jgi:hypothetical protein
MSQLKKPDESNEPEPLILPKVTEQFDPDPLVPKEEPVIEPDVHERAAADDAPISPFAEIDKKRGESEL